MITTDSLSWEEFNINSSKNKSIVNEIKPFNRLVCHTKNFFVVVGYGAFTKAYALIISKELIPSFANIDMKNKDEFFWLQSKIYETFMFLYKAHSFSFEHGMCACVGGLDRAHYHIMGIENYFDIENKDTIIINIINKILKRRAAGIDYIKFNNTIIRNKIDISSILNNGNAKDIEISGSFLNFSEIQNLDLYKDYPNSVTNWTLKGNSYVLFNGVSKNSSFLSTINIDTQLGREIIFEALKMIDKKFEKKFQKLEIKFPYKNFWRWQEEMFNENMLINLNNMLKYFRNTKIENKYNFKYI